MKFLLTLSLLFSTAALAHPGGNTLKCKLANPNSKFKNLDVSVFRSNGTGWSLAGFSINYNGKSVVINSDDEMHSFGSTQHISPLGAITVTANNQEEPGNTMAGLTITAVPSTVKAYDNEGKLVKYSLKDHKRDGACYDSNGKAVFKGLLQGYLSVDQNSPSEQNINFNVEVMDCELTYNSGMAC